MSEENFFTRVFSSSVGTDENIVSCLENYDEDKDDALNLSEMTSLLNELFIDANGKSYNLPLQMPNEIFTVFDVDRDKKIDFKELKIMWDSFIVPIMRPKTALVIIDVQNDFIDGSLALRRCPAGQEGEEVVPVINNLIKTVFFDYVVYSYDWHPENHISFIDNVHHWKIHESSPISAIEAKVFDTVIFEVSTKVEQKLWPRHCVMNSWGSELHPELEIADNSIFIYKGTHSDIDSYSAFWDNEKRSQTVLDKKLQSKGVTDIFICGLATDFCVGSTALHALEHGYKTILIDDASRGVDSATIEVMKSKFKANWGIIVTSDKVKDLVTALDRHPNLGFNKLLHIKKCAKNVNDMYSFKET